MNSYLFAVEQDSSMVLFRNSDVAHLLRPFGMTFMSLVFITTFVYVIVYQNLH